MKGSNKKFARFLESEYYDDVLEAPEEDQMMFDDYENSPDKNFNLKTNDKDSSHLFKASEEGQDHQKKSPPKKNNQNKQKLALNPDIPQTPLTDSLIKNFATVLGPEAVKFYKNLREIKVIRDAKIIETYRDLYDKFETIPVLFLSVVPGEAVYLWQINRKCPYQRDTKHLILDSKALNKETRRHISILMLAKIAAGQNEQLLEAKFIGDNKFFVKCKTIPGSVQGAIKIYNITNFASTARVNPYNYDILANDYYSLRVLLKGIKIQDEDCLELSLYRRKTLKEVSLERSKLFECIETEESIVESAEKIELEALQDTKICKNVSYVFKVDETTFSEVINGFNHSLIFIDKANSLFLAIQDSSFSILNYGSQIGFIESIFETQGHCYLVSTKREIFELKLKDFTIADCEISFSPEPIAKMVSGGFPSRLYEIVLSDQIPKALYLSSRRIYSISIQKDQNNLTFPTSLDLKGSFSRPEAFDWVPYGPKKNMIMTIYNGAVYLQDFQEGEKISIKAFDNLNIYSYTACELIGSGEKIYVIEKLSGHLYQIIKLSTDNNEILNPNLFTIEVEDKRFAIDNSERLFYQIEGFDQEILFIRFKNEPFYLDTENLMYGDSIFLFNPHEEIKTGDPKSKIIREDEEEKEKKMTEKIKKAKAVISINSKNAHECLEETKEALKEIRRDISSRITEVKKFDEEYAKSSKDDGPKSTKQLKEPKGVSEESLEVYQQLKTEKKKIAKQKEKDKTKSKKGRAEKFDM